MEIASLYYWPDVSSGSLFTSFLLALPVLFFLFCSFVSRACVYSEHGTAGEPRVVAGVSGCWRVEGGGARSAVAVVVARRCVCLETQGMNEWTLSGLHL